MPAESKWRGNSIYFDCLVWRYVSDNKPVSEEMYKTCGHCGMEQNEFGHDACIANLPGVRNACCGHGIEADAYVQYEIGHCIRGKAAITIQNKLKENQNASN